MALETELSSYLDKNKALQLHVDDQDSRSKARELELTRERVKSAGLYNTLHRLKNDLGTAAQNVSNPQELAALTRNMYKNYCDKV